MVVAGKHVAFLVICGLVVEIQPTLLLKLIVVCSPSNDNQVNDMDL